MLTIILIIIIGLYIATYCTRNTPNKFGQKSTRLFRQIHFGLLVLLIILGVLANYNIYLRGYWTTKILIWFYILSAMTLFALGEKTLQKKIERIYYSMFFYFPLVAIPLLFLPYLGTGIVLGIFGHTIGDSNDIKYSDKNFRLQNTFHGFMAPPSAPDLFVKRGILEYKEEPLDMEYLYRLDSIRIENELTKEITILFYDETVFAETHGPLKVKVLLKH
jgi:hypothetical protein